MPSKYVKTGQTPEGKAKRLRAFRHNSYLGLCVRIYKQAFLIQNSDTVTFEAAQIADEIGTLALKLQQALKTRID